MVTKNSVPVLVIALIMVLTACAGSSNTPPPPADTPEPASQPTDTPSPAPTDTPLPPTDTPPPPTDTPPPSPTDTPQPSGATPAPSSDAPVAQSNTGEVISSGWQVETIDAGIKPAIALDSQDRPHVTYMIEAEEGYVRYAFRSDDSWSLNTVAEGYFYGPPDIAVGNDDTPHIVWHDHQDVAFKPDLGDAVRAELRDGEWSVTTISHPGHDGWDNSVIVDSQNAIHTASIDPSQFGSQDGVEYASSITSWQVEAIGSGPIAYEFGTAVNVDSQNQPGITYYNDVIGVLEYAHRSADGVWTITTVDEGGRAGKFSALDFDADGQPHISYFAEESPSSGTVRYAFWDDSAWQIEDVDNVTDVKQGFVGARHLTWLRLDSQGRPHLAFNDQSQLKYAIKTDGGWQIEVVGERGPNPFGQLVMMELDRQDRPHLVYTVFTDPSQPEGVVKYATKRE